MHSLPIITVTVMSAINNAVSGSYIAVKYGLMIFM